jgi:putative transposase
LAARLSLVDRSEPDRPIAAQCRLLKVARSTLYYRPLPARVDDLRLMRWLDEQFLKTPFYGSRRMVAVMQRDGFVVNRKRVKRLMRVMGIEAIYQKTQYQSRPSGAQGVPLPAAGSDNRPAEPGVVRRHYLCANGQGVCVSGRGHGLVQPAGVVVADVDFDGFGFLRGGVARGDGEGRPEIFNTDQGVQFTSADFLAGLEAQEVRISMDGKGRYLDNIFIERLWRSLKYEEIFLKAYGSPAEGAEWDRRVAELLLIGP